MSLGTSKHDKTFIIFTLHINIKVLENLIVGIRWGHMLSGGDLL